MAGIYEIDNSLESELSKAEKIERIDLIFTETYQNRSLKLVKMAEVYFTTLGLKMPDELFYSDIITPLIYPEDKKQVKKALSDIKQYAMQYHVDNTIKISIDKVTKNTLLKIINKTFYGTRLELTGINGKLSDNIKAGYIPKPALEIIIYRILEKENVTPDIKIAFNNEQKIKYISEKFKELLKEA